LLLFLTTLKFLTSVQLISKACSHVSFIIPTTNKHDMAL
jgi:hypothetical protein